MIVFCKYKKRVDSVNAVKVDKVFFFQEFGRNCELNYQFSKKNYCHGHLHTLQFLLSRSFADKTFLLQTCGKNEFEYVC